METPIFITLTGINLREKLRHFNIYDRVILIKEYDNQYDQEAIRVEAPYHGKIGYVANSVATVAKGTISAGRLYDKFQDYCFGTFLFITSDAAILKVEFPKLELFKAQDKAKTIDTQLEAMGFKLNKS